jgi:hypothetical protein
MTETVNAADPAEEKRLREEERQLARNDAAVIRKIMMTHNGRAWIYRFLERCSIFGDTFHGEETHRSAFAQGQENIGKQLWLAVQDASLDLYVQMVKEQREEEKRLAKVRRADGEAQTPEAIDAEEALGVNAHMIDLPAPEGWGE